MAFSTISFTCSGICILGFDSAISQPLRTYSITASARPSNGRDDALTKVDQLLRKGLAVLDASGTPDGFNNFGGVTSSGKSLSASVSNGLRSTLILEGAAFAASL